MQPTPDFDFDSLFKNVPALIAVLSGPEHVYTYANPLYLTSVRKNGADIIGLPIRKALPELEGQGIYELLDNAYATCESCVIDELKVNLDVHGNGHPEEMYFKMIYNPMFDDQRKITGLFIHATDITDIVKKHKSVEENKVFLQNLIINAPVAIGIFKGKDLIIDLANEKILTMWNRSEAVLGMKLEDALPELKGQKFLGILNEIFETGTPYHAVEEKAYLMTGDGLRPFWFNFTYQPIFDAAGKVESILDMAIDVTDQVNAKEELLYAQSKLRSAIEVAELGTWELDPVNKTMTMNDRLREWRGIEKGKILSTDNLFDNILDDDVIKNELQKALDPKGDGLLNIEYETEDKHTGKKRTIHSQGKTFFDESGNPVLVTGISQDVTLQRFTQTELARRVNEQMKEIALVNDDLKSLNANLEQFVYVASHDLQEPLRKINIFSEMLQKSSAELNAEGKMFLGKIEKAAKRMSLLLNDLLEFSRITSKGKEFVPTDLNKIINNILVDYELLIKQKQAVITVDTLPLIEAVPLQMNQLFYNLIGNALKFAKADEPVNIKVTAGVPANEELKSLRLDAGYQYCMIIVTDTGIGFDQQYSKQIFEIFQRLHGKHEYAGTGIGLALAKKIADNHGGTIIANSEEGKGAEFRIFLPVTR